MLVIWSVFRISYLKQDLFKLHFCYNPKILLQKAMLRRTNLVKRLILYLGISIPDNFHITQVYGLFYIIISIICEEIQFKLNKTCFKLKVISK